MASVFLINWKLKLYWKNSTLRLLEPKLGPGWVKNGKKGYFYASHLTSNPVIPESKVLNSSPDTREESFSISLLKSILSVLTSQAERFISLGISCSYLPRNWTLSFLLLHDFKVLVKLRGVGTLLCLASSVNF